MTRALTCILLLASSSVALAGDTTATGQGPWWLGHVLTTIAAILGALMIVFQLGRQHRNESDRQTQNFKGQLRLQVYQEFSARLASAADAVGSSGMYAFTGPMHADIYRKQVAMRLNPNPITDRAIQFLEKNSSAASEVVEVVFLVEKYFIVHPDLDIFRLALSSAMHDLSAAFHMLFDFMLKHYPVDLSTPAGTVVQNSKVLSDTEFEDLERLANGYHDAAADLDGYLSDMRTELQTLLLSYIFPNTIPKRRPADPSKKVVTLEPATVKSLRQYFLKNTAWGKSAVGTQLAVHREFHGRI